MGIGNKPKFSSFVEFKNVLFITCFHSPQISLGSSEPSNKKIKEEKDQQTLHAKKHQQGDGKPIYSCLIEKKV